MTSLCLWYTDWKSGSVILMLVSIESAKGFGQPRSFPAPPTGEYGTSPKGYADAVAEYFRKLSKSK